MFVFQIKDILQKYEYYLFQNLYFSLHLFFWHTTLHIFQSAHRKNWLISSRTNTQNLINLVSQNKYFRRKPYVICLTNDYGYSIKNCILFLNGRKDFIIMSILLQRYKIVIELTESS